MSSLALTKNLGLLIGLGAPTAGDLGRSIGRLTLVVLEDLKSSVRAGSSSVFSDLQALAQESNTQVHESKALVLAQRFLLALPVHLPMPELSLDSDGEVSFDWMGPGGRLLTATLREDGRISYAARISSTDKDHGTKQFVDSIPERLSDLVQEVTDE